MKGWLPEALRDAGLMLLGAVTVTAGALFFRHDLGEDAHSNIALAVNAAMVPALVFLGWAIYRTRLW